MNKTKLMFVLLASLFLGACSSDDDNNGGNGGNGGGATYTETEVSEAPVWQIDWTNNQERPNWSEPDGSLYENWTTLMVQIEETLQPYASEDDLLALFVNDELRGLASPAVIVDGEQSGNTQFLMKAWGNETGTEKVNVSLRYYNQKLKHIFTLSDDIVLNSDETTGIEEDFIPEFTLGSAKYPVVKTVGVESILTKVGITAGQTGLAGAFVDEECRGTATLSASGGTSLTIYGRSAGESITLKYYDAAKGVLYTIPNAVKLN
ncbi:MAG: hypothetical protein IKZ62_02935 [Prevotella sp.]|nr:hypothetical protein [Prevotella sp.]